MMKKLGIISNSNNLRVSLIIEINCDKIITPESLRCMEAALRVILINSVDAAWRMKKNEKNKLKSSQSGNIFLKLKASVDVR